MLYIENKWELNLYLEKNVWFKIWFKKRMWRTIKRFYSLSVKNDKKEAEIFQIFSKC